MNIDTISQTIITTTIFSGLSTIITNSNIKDIINNNLLLILLILFGFFVYKYTTAYHDIWYHNIIRSIYTNISHTVYVSCTQTISIYGHKYANNGKYFNEVLFYMNKKYSHLYNIISYEFISHETNINAYDTSGISLDIDNIKIYSLKLPKLNTKFQEIVYTFVIKGTYDNIQKFFDNCIQFYEINYYIDNCPKSQYVYYLRGFFLGDDQHLLSVVEKIQFNTNRTFSNIIFKQKLDFIKTLHSFLDNPIEYERIGKPHHLGILLSGQPGTGKTSLIKALAKSLNRHILLINLKIIENYHQLLHIFTSTSLNVDTVPIDKRIIVFEDIDCMSNIILSREHKMEDDRSLVMIEEKKDDPEKKLIKKTPIDKLTLSDILNVIDGVIECSGRIMIMTSNYPEKLDSALIRHGRIDIHVNMEFFEKNEIIEYINLYYNSDVKDIVGERLLKSTIQPAQLERLCMDNNIDTLINILFA